MSESPEHGYGGGHARTMVYFGCAVVVLALADFTLSVMGAARSFLVWTLMLPAAVVGALVRRAGGRGAATSPDERPLRSVWTGYVVSLHLLIATLSLTALFSGEWRAMRICTPAIMLMTGMAEYAAGRICRFRPFTRGACVFWAGALLCVPVGMIGRGEWRFAVLAACMFAGFVLPGYMFGRMGNNRQ